MHTRVNNAKALLAQACESQRDACRWLFRPNDKWGEERCRKRFVEALEMIDGALAQVGGSGPFFLGDQISLVDVMVVPFLERQNSSLLYWKGFKLRNGGYTNIDRCASARTVCA